MNNDEKLTDNKGNKKIKIIILKTKTRNQIGSISSFQS